MSSSEHIPEDGKEGNWLRLVAPESMICYVRST